MARSTDEKLGTAQEDLMLQAVENLIAVCGYDKSESASEWFLTLLEDAVNIVGVAIEQSHDHGLCLDVRSALTTELARLAPDAVEEYSTAQKGVGA